MRISSCADRRTARSCSSPASTLSSSTGTTTAGISRARPALCSYRQRPRPGEPFGGSCTNGGNTNSGGFAIGYSGEVVGTDVLEVGGTRVSTVHLVVNEKMTGDTVGTGTASLWLDSQTGLLVKETRTENTRSQSAVGWVPSAESFSLNLLSLDPQT